MSFSAMDKSITYLCFFAALTGALATTALAALAGTAAEADCGEGRRRVSFAVESGKHKSGAKGQSKLRRKRTHHLSKSSGFSGSLLYSVVCAKVCVRQE